MNEKQIAAALDRDLASALIGVEERARPEREANTTDRDIRVIPAVNGLGLGGVGVPSESASSV